MDIRNKGYISYRKLLDRMEKSGVTSYTIRKSGLIGQGTVSSILTGRSKAAEGSGRGTAINTETIAALCWLLKCQPGDLLEYVEEGGEAGETAGEDSTSRETGKSE